VSDTSLNQESFEPGSVDCLLLVPQLSRKIIPHCEKLAYFIVIKSITEILILTVD